MITTAKQIHQELLQAENILLVSHKNPDGDTLSSACALMQYLRKMEKPHTAFCATPLNPQLAFLPHLEYFVSEPRVFETGYFDAVVVLDSGDLLYAGVDQHLGVPPLVV